MTYIPFNLYEVRFYDREKNFKFIPPNLSRIEYRQRLNAPWNHQITVEISKEHPQLNVLRSVEDDWFIRIFRLDPFTQIKTLVYSGLHVTTVDQARTSGDLIFNYYGSGFTQLLSRRVVLPDPGSDNSTKTGSAETVIKSFISDSMVSPYDTDRIFPGVTLELDTLSGDYVEHSTRYVNLLTVCETVANAGKVDFGIIEDSDIGELIVRVKPVWGKDRRVGNLAGNKPTFFNFLYGNMDIPIFTTNASDEKNYIYVGGAGSGEERIIMPVSDLLSTARSAWSRREFFVEARQQETDLALVLLGEAELEARKLKKELNFDIIQNIGTRWLVDWELGDLITAKYFDYKADKKITEVGVVVSASESQETVERVFVEMEDVRLDTAVLLNIEEPAIIVAPPPAPAPCEGFFCGEGLDMVWRHFIDFRDATLPAGYAFTGVNDHHTPGLGLWSDVQGTDDKTATGILIPLEFNTGTSYIKLGGIAYTTLGDDNYDNTSSRIMGTENDTIVSYTDATIITGEDPAVRGTWEITRSCNILIAAGEPDEIRADVVCFHPPDTDAPSVPANSNIIIGVFIAGDGDDPFPSLP